jgi:CRP-like cAMP-binding protein
MAAPQNGFAAKRFVQYDPSAFIADPELLAALEKRSRPVACDKERILFREGEDPVGLYILEKGYATLRMESKGADSTFAALATPGSLLGLPGLACNQPYTLTAMAHAGAQVSFVPREAFSALMQSEPALSLKILQVLAAEVRSARKAIV